MKRLTVSAFLLIVIVSGCDKGLEPNSVAPTVIHNGSYSGLITFRNWQVVDTMYDMRLAAFRDFPPTSLINDVQNGRAVIYPPVGGGALITSRTDSIRFRVDLQPATYKYVAVALQFGPNLFQDWLVVGQYDLDTNLVIPTPVVIKEDSLTPDININVDFSHPPPPPF